MHTEIIIYGIRESGSIGDTYSVYCLLYYLDDANKSSTTSDIDGSQEFARCCGGGRINVHFNITESEIRFFF